MTRSQQNRCSDDVNILLLMIIAHEILRMHVRLALALYVFRLPRHDALLVSVPFLPRCISYGTYVAYREERSLLGVVGQGAERSTLTREFEASTPL